MLVFKVATIIFHSNNLKHMKLFHAFTYDKMHQIKKHGLIASMLDNLIYCCDNDEDAVEWILQREHIRGKKLNKLGMVMFNADAQPSDDHSPVHYKGVKAYTVKGNIHPSELTFISVDITEDYLWQKREDNNIPYQEPTEELLFEIYKSSMKNIIMKHKTTGRLQVGNYGKLTEDDYKFLFKERLKNNFSSII